MEQHIATPPVSSILEAPASLGHAEELLHARISGTECLIRGLPESSVLEASLAGPGDLWHSGLLRGCGGVLSEIVYYLQVYSYYLNDVDANLRSVSWRVDPSAFAIRSSVWEALDGFDVAYESEAARALDLGFRALQNGGIPLHVPGLFESKDQRAATQFVLSREDVYLFFCRHFKREYRLYALIREAIKRRSPAGEFRAFREAEARAADMPPPRTVAIRPRVLIQARPAGPRVSAIIPTLRRQDYTARLLDDYTKQTLPLHQVIVVDATPEAERDESVYEKFSSSLPLEVIWQESLGSCRARNEAISLCTGDYILFADDDTRVPPDFVENHVRLLETYRAEASQGLDVRADHHQQTIDDLARKLESYHGRGDRIGVSRSFNNANSCVRRDWVEACVGNDVNFDGGYGEDWDFGFRIIERGGVLLYNPFSANLHLKPPSGGFRWWGEQAKLRRRRKVRQPWEVNRQVGWLKPRPSPTILYAMLKHYTSEQVREWLYVYLLRSWWPTFARPEESRAKRILLFPFRLLGTPRTLLRIRSSFKFASDLVRRGQRFN